MKQIKDITIKELKMGLNWRIYYPENIDEPLENCMIEQVDEFNPEDVIAYSAICVTEDGQVTPLIQIKEVGDSDYGGDFCEWIDGKWQQVGLVPNPEALPSIEYIANPLDIDPSFDSEDDFRAENRDNFNKFVSKIVE